MGFPSGDVAATYAGYAKRGVPAPDDELTKVGTGTPCGEYLRSVWQPVCLSEQLAERPLAVRVLGEDLVAFRDRASRVGVLHLHCSHRGASLEFGILVDRGISCCYHGWTYDVDGRILDTPGEPATSRIKDRLRHGAYPAAECDGLVFAYLGDPADVPPLPRLDTQDEAGVVLKPFSLELPCNWLQVYENAQDPIHVVYLHARIAGAHFDESNAAEQELDFVATPLGMANAQTRRWGAMVWTRTVECILPNLNQTGAIWEDARQEKAFQRVGLTRWTVPIDDTHTRQIGWRHLGAHLDPNGKDRPDQIGVGHIDLEGQDESRSYAERQKRPGDGDAMVSQRPIAVHALENLATTDRGVAMLRRLLRQAVRAYPGSARGTGVEHLDTYCQDTVTAIPLAGGDDRALLRSHGDAVVRAVVDSAGLPRSVREHQVRAAALAVRDAAAVDSIEHPHSEMAK